MADEEISFHNHRGQRLAGVLSGQLGGVAVISCHGMLSSKAGTKHVLLAHELQLLSLPCLRFDFAGRGDSEGSLLELSYSNEVEDLDAAVDWLAARGVHRIGLFGSSMGGAVALLAAARDERINAVATLAAVGHPDSVAERHPEEYAAWLSAGYVETPEGRIGRGFVDDAECHDVVAAVRVLHAPILVLHGEQDEVVPVTDAHDIATAARNASLEIVHGADHRFSRPVHLRPAMRQIAAFLAAHLSL